MFIKSWRCVLIAPLGRPVVPEVRIDTDKVIIRNTYIRFRAITSANEIAILAESCRFVVERNPEFDGFQFRGRGLDNFTEFLIKNEKTRLMYSKICTNSFCLSRLFIGTKMPPDLAQAKYVSMNSGQLCNSTATLSPFFNPIFKKAVSNAIDSAIQLCITGPLTPKNQSRFVREVEGASSKNISNTHSMVSHWNLS